jgi:hypothetical protein
LGADYLGTAPRWSSVFFFTLQIMNLSFIYAWMRLKSGSVRTVILHATHNIVVQGIFDNMIRHTRLTNWVVGEGGIGIAVSSGIIAYALWRRDPHPDLLDPPHNCCEQVIAKHALFIRLFWRQSLQSQFFISSRNEENTLARNRK